MGARPNPHPDPRVEAIVQAVGELPYFMKLNRLRSYMRAELRIVVGEALAKAEGARIDGLDDAGTLEP